MRIHSQILVFAALLILILPEHIIAESYSNPVRVSKASQMGINIIENPDIAVAGNGIVYAVWEQKNESSSYPYLNISCDGGVTFLSEPVNILDRLIWSKGTIANKKNSPDNIYEYEYRNLKVRATADGNCYIVAQVYEPLSISRKQGIYLFSSLDKGASFRMTRVDKYYSDGEAYYPQIAIYDGNYLSESGNPGFYRYIGQHGSKKIKAAYYKDFIFITWNDKRAETSYVAFNRSTDSGRTFQNNDTLIFQYSASPPCGPEMPFSPPRMAVSLVSGDIYLTWKAINNFQNTDIFFTHSSNLGQSFSKTRNFQEFIGTIVKNRAHEIYANESSGKVWVHLFSTTQTDTLGWKLFLSQDKGMTFREETMTLNYKMIKPTENDCYSPRMTGAGENNLFMVFIDSDGKVLTSSSYSGGNNLGNNPVMIHGIPYGENYYASMDIQREEAVRLAVWQGYDQNSQQAIYCSRSRKNRCLILNRAKPPWDTMAWDYFMLFYELGMPLDLIEVKNVLPEDLTPCKYGFLMVLLGDNDHGVGEGGEDAGTLTLEELDEILDFADSGGRVHIEGARFYQDHKDLPINFAHEFGITNSTFYSYPYELDMLLPRRNEKLKINFAYIQGWAPESYSISKDADVYLWDEHLTPVKYYGVFRNWDGNVSLTSMPIWFINENDTTSKRDVINELFNVNFQSKAWQYGNPPFIEVEFEPGPQQFMNAQTGHESGGQDAYSTIKVDIKINALCAFADTLDLYSLVITDADTIQELIKKEYLDLDPGSSVNYNDLEVPVSQGSDNNPNGSSWIEVLMEQPVYWNPYQGMIPPIHYNMHFYSF